jgi:hypothetical protein
MYVYVSCMYQYVYVHICLYLLSVSADNVLERAFSLILRVIITGKQIPFLRLPDMPVLQKFEGWCRKFPAGSRDLSERYISYLDKKT